MSTARANTTYRPKILRIGARVKQVNTRTPHYGSVGTVMMFYARSGWVLVDFDYHDPEAYTPEDLRVVG